MRRRSDRPDRKPACTFTSRRWGSWIKSIAVMVSVLLLMSGVTIAGLTRLGAGQYSGADRSFVTGPLGPQPRMVFAHYFPPYPISIDNLDPESDYYTTQYLNPDGEKGAHAVYGGLLRDRPLPRSRRHDPDWRQLDLAEEIRQASSAGIDGFSVDILTTHDSKNPIATVPSALLQAAENTNPLFKIMLMPDMDGDLGKLTPGQLASQISLLASSAAAFRLTDGRLVVAPFRAENRPVPWWRDFISAMKSQYGIDVALLPVFLDSSAANIAEFSPIAFGMSDWGSKNPAFNPVEGHRLDVIRTVNDLDQLWMQPVSMQDYRPLDQIYDEAENTTNLRNTWNIAIDGKARWVQIVTWNDYSENTGIAPSVRHRTALLDICSYYIAYFKSGLPPPIAEDRVFLTHRTQLIGATPSRQVGLATIREGSTPGRDAVEALSFLTSPATVTVSVGPSKTVCNAPAGVSSCVAPIGELGPHGLTVSAEASRDEKPVVTVVSRYKIVADPVVQDLSYTVSEGRASGS